MAIMIKKIVLLIISSKLVVTINPAFLEKNSRRRLSVSGHLLSPPPPHTHTHPF